jgi:putative membrane protein
MKETVNKDLILRERLALQRTILANQTTVLAFFVLQCIFFAGLRYQKSIEN